MTHGDNALLIDELAARTGMTVRNIRAHQSRGLLPPPVRSGRRAFYSPAHVQRLRRIVELQQQGFNLAAIGALVAAEEGDAAATRVALLRVAVAPLLRDDSFRLTREQLEQLFRGPYTEPRGRLAMEAGLLRLVGAGTFELPSRRLVEVAAALIAEGVEAVDVADLMRDMRRSTEPLADNFVRLCLRLAAEPFGGERLREMQQLFRRLQELGVAVLTGTFALTVRQAAQRHLDGIAEAPAERAADATDP